MTFNLSTYACKSSQSKGRLYDETRDQSIDSFQDDQSRIINSLAFRRLEHKTQVFTNTEGDHYRTRLTHTIEVAQIARIMATRLRLNADLAVTIALAHDLGHPPFGHSGESGLNEAAEKFGGFDHNAHTIKVITDIERKYIAHNGLNLTFEALDGIAKHNGPLNSKKRGHQDIISMLEPLFIKFGGGPNTHPTLEAQIAALADDIAYCSHDIDDGIRAGFFDINQLAEIPFIYSVFSSIRQTYVGITKEQLINEGCLSLTRIFMEDAIEQTSHNLSLYDIESAEDIYRCGNAIATFSSAITQAQQDLKTFLMRNVYKHYKLNRISQRAKGITRYLFEKLYECPSCLPDYWQHIALSQNEQMKAKTVLDYIAGMTDRYAIAIYDMLYA